jgi:glutamate-5-semialdehyde dehydrogenase
VPTLTETVTATGRAARDAAPALAAAPDKVINTALEDMAIRLTTASAAVLEASTQDTHAAQNAGMPTAMLDRLRLDEQRLAAMAQQIHLVAQTPFPPTSFPVRDLPGGLRVTERRRPIGVIGANYEARPNVTIDIASQLVKSRNAGVLRTGSAALRTALAIGEHIITPALTHAGLHPATIQVIDSPDRAAATALVSLPDLIPLVILRGSGQSTRELVSLAAQHGVGTLAHADGGGVLYIDRNADATRALQLIEDSLDRLGVCNRLNLLLIHDGIHDEILPNIVNLLDKLGIAASLPPHPHPRGQEWALVEGHEATVTIDTVTNPTDAAQVAGRDTSGLAATIVTDDPAAAETFLDAYTGTGALWNATTRLIDGYKLLGIPETGINVARTPGPRGPVTFHDLALRQYVVTPTSP